ncbi:hypothetical protein CAE01nite_25080 [Cellulomonas aerilata]|uniref:Uncharacterized protein n=1 Tax=Cellulomonas aerilata TaxID=515326 RepID=A0A512DE90_9CELL|nr:hypothetical protein CAE01nite_25080 [Cellulomonas aerilata]
MVPYSAVREYAASATKAVAAAASPAATISTTVRTAAPSHPRGPADKARCRRRVARLRGDVLVAMVAGLPAAEGSELTHRTAA